MGIYALRRLRLGFCHAGHATKEREKEGGGGDRSSRFVPRQGQEKETREEAQKFRRVRIPFFVVAKHKHGSKNKKENFPDIAL